MSVPQGVDGVGDVPANLDLQALFHRLNNQLGSLLAHAELLETKAPDDVNRARAAQVVRSTLDAMGTVRAIYHQTDPSGE
ncbi:MAG TPA: hypothetical protein VFO58_03840 [Vicinamibacterales bacterium]|nr:hypothetical protein [Vicinamibacterales bacterium]